MIKEHFFPTIIYAKDIQIDNNLLSNVIVEMSKTDEGIKKTNMHGWHSRDLNTSHKDFEPLVKELYNMQNEIYEEEWLDRKPMLGNLWANLNPPGGYNRPHIHANSLWSGVYYVKATENSGKLVCSDPRPGIQMNMPVRKSGTPPQHLWRECHLAPISGRIIMFPAWLWHCVEPNNSDDIRISVSFNFVQDGFNV
tara:strand:+ start:5715 stop:6299 length:585 start_codon:yes stop_codon:yes gene_type:complete